MIIISIPSTSCTSIQLHKSNRHLSVRVWGLNAIGSISIQWGQCYAIPAQASFAGRRHCSYIRPINIPRLLLGASALISPGMISITASCVAADTSRSAPTRIKSDSTKVRLEHQKKKRNNVRLTPLQNPLYADTCLMSDREPPPRTITCMQ